MAKVADNHTEASIPRGLSWMMKICGGLRKKGWVSAEE